VLCQLQPRQLVLVARASLLEREDILRVLGVLRGTRLVLRLRRGKRRSEFLVGIALI
jgi:hypothetical protein